MDFSELQAIAARGETFTVEFKSERKGSLSDAELVKNCVCLANGQGGLLILGIENDGALSGSRPRHGQLTDPARVQALVANRTQPPLSTTVVLVRGDEQEFVVIDVPSSEQPVGTNQGEYVRRATKVDGTPQCVPYMAHEMLGRVIDSRQQDYARLRISGLSWDDLDPLEFERFRRLSRLAGPNGDPAVLDLSDYDIALALGIADRGDHGDLEPLAGALLLFGKEEAIGKWLPTSEVLFQVFEGTRLRVDETWKRPLLAIAESVFGRVQAFNSETEVDLGVQRLAIPKLPSAVIRETVANALIHRDYTVIGPTVIQLGDASFEVTSPGGFPPGVTLANVFNVTRPRSPLLSEAFKRAGFVERSGRGVKRMFESLLATGRRGPDYRGTSNELVHVTIPLADGDLELAEWFAREEQSGRRLDLFGLQVLFELKDVGPLDLSQISAVTHQNDYQTRSLLARLVESGYVETRGSSRTPEYHLASTVYRAMGSSSAYVRVHGFEPEQNQQMIMSYVKAHGRITRREAADLCQTDPRDASRLLRRLASEGKLRIVGERRLAHYVAGRL